MAWSLFGYNSDSVAATRAYDMMVLDQIEKDEKEYKARRIYGSPFLNYEDEEVEDDDNDSGIGDIFAGRIY